MLKFKILNSKETKKFYELVDLQWGCKLDLDYVFLRSKDDKIFIVNKDIAKINFDNLRMNSMGLYIAETGSGDIRLSIEGAQLIGPKAKKNIIDLNESETISWLKGEDLELSSSCSGFVILKHKEDYLGTGKIKEDKILNFIPKTRRFNIKD